MDFGRKDYNEFLKRGNFSDEGDVELILSDEPVFLIRSSDPLGPEIMLMYASKVLARSKDNTEVAMSVVDHAQKMISYQRKHGVKEVDLDNMDQSKEISKASIMDIVNKIEDTNKLDSQTFEELQKLMDEVYGPYSLKVLLPSEITTNLSDENDLTSELQIKVIDSNLDVTKYNLVLAVTETKTWYIISMNLL